MNIKKEDIKDFIKELEQEYENMNIFFKTKQEDVMERIYRFLSDDQEIINNKDLLYFPKRYPITDREFYYLTENIFNYAKHKNYVLSYEDIMFENDYVLFIYKNTVFKLFKMWGQGTFVDLRRASKNEECYIEDNRNDFVFNYEEIKIVD